MVITGPSLPYDRRVTFWDVVQPRHVHQAVAEYDRLGQDEFLALHGFGRARAYLLIIDGKAYDSKAILGVAYWLRHRTAPYLGGVQRRRRRRGRRAARAGIRSTQFPRSLTRQL